MAEQDLIKKYLEQGLGPDEIESRLRLRRAAQGMPQPGTTAVLDTPAAPGGGTPKGLLLPPAPNMLPPAMERVTLPDGTERDRPLSIGTPANQSPYSEPKAAKPSLPDPYPGRPWYIPPGDWKAMQDNSSVDPSVATPPPTITMSGDQPRKVYGQKQPGFWDNLEKDMWPGGPSKPVSFGKGGAPDLWKGIQRTFNPANDPRTAARAGVPYVDREAQAKAEAATSPVGTPAEERAKMGLLPPKAEPPAPADAAVLPRGPIPSGEEKTPGKYARKPEKDAEADGRDLDSPPSSPTAAAATGPAPGTDREDRIRKLEGIAGIAEGMGQMGRVTTGAMIRAGVEPPPQLVATDTRRKLAQAEDLMTPDERRALKEQFGLEVGPDGRLSRMASMLPSIAAMDKVELAQQRQKDTLEAKKRDRMSTVGNQFAQIPIVREARNQNLSVAKGLADLQANTPMGDMSALINAARAAGEKGPLSDQDIERWLTRMGIVNHFVDFLSQKGTGRLSQGQRQEIEALLHQYQRVNNGAIRDQANSWAGRNAKLYGGEPGEWAASVLNAGEDGEPAANMGGAVSTAGAGMLDFVDPKSGKHWPVHPERVAEAEKRGLQPVKE